MIKVSVIMPVYNSEEYLSDAVESFRCQSLKDIELICVDDGSTDNSLNILRDFAARDPRITVISQDNKGPGTARNAALQSAEGEYVSFLDSDDKYAGSDVLETLYRLAKRDDADAAGGSLTLLQNGISQKGVVGGIDYTFKKEAVISYRDLQQAFYYQRFIYSKDILVRNKVVFPDYRRFQDVVFFVNAMSLCGKIAVTDRPVYLYRVSDKSFSASYNALNDFLQGHVDVLRIAMEKGYETLFAWCVKRILYKGITNSVIEEAYSSGNKEIRKYISDIKTMILEHKYPITKKELSYLDVFLNDCVFENESQILELCKNTRSGIQAHLTGEEPLVTIIVPVYNVERYIDTTLRSITGQKYRNIEIICINDGSTDNSLQILYEWQVKDNRVKIISQTNKGLSAARNAGIKASCGKYIQFVDSDDAIPDESIAAFVNCAELNKLDMISFDARTLYEDYELAFHKSSFMNRYTKRSARPGVISGKNLIASQIENDSYITLVQLLFFKRDFIVDNGLQFMDGILHEDNLFTFEAMLKAGRCMYLNETGYLRRIRKNSIMTTEFGFSNIYGIFACYLNMKKTSEAAELDLLQKHYINQLLKSTLNTTKSWYAGLSEEEKDKYSLYMEGDRLYDFEVLIKEPYEKDIQIASFREKVKKHQKLIQQMEKTNKELNSKAEEQDEKVRKLQGQLNREMNSWNYRIGKCLTFFPKKVYYYIKPHGK